MGRNADKRRARKGQGAGDDPASAEPRLEKRPEPASEQRHVVDASVAQPASAPRSLVGGLEAWADADGSLARALFKVTCLLAVRDAHGVSPEHMARVASEVASIVEADTVSILRLDKGDDMVPARLVLVGSHGLAPLDRGLVVFELGDGFAGQVAQTGVSVRIEDAPRDPRFQRLYGQRTEIGSLLAVPLMFGKRVLGVITASRREIRAFSDADEDRLQFVADSIGQDLEQTRLLFEAVTDPLTGLGSRLSLLVTLPREVELARRYRTDLSIIMLDVDGLGAINRAHGRSGGDRVLVEAGRRLRELLRGADLPVRMGPDEFAILVPMTSANNARALAKRLVRALSAPFPGVDVVPTFSVGVATLALADEDALSLLWRCDEAVGAAKAEGGDRIMTAPQRRAEPGER